MSVMDEIDPIKEVRVKSTSNWFDALMIISKLNP